jgi:hypothetical protein
MHPRFPEPPIGRGPAADSDAEREQHELQERFDRILKGRFDIVRGDQFTSTLPGIDAITIAPITKEDGSAFINIIPLRRDDRGVRTALDTTQLFEDGRLVGRLGPRMQGITKAQILREVLDIMEAAGLGTYPAYNANVEILPGEVVVTPTRPEPEPFKGVEHAHDPRREAFLRKQDGALFMFKTRGSRGFGGMYVYVFEGGLFVDSELTDYAAFIFKQPEGTRIARDPNMPSPKDPEAFTAWVQQQPWFPPLRTPRTEAWKSGVAEHMPHRGAWEPRIQAAVDTLK